MRKAQKEQVEELLKLLEQAHEEIKRNIEKRNFEPVLVTLADCQDCAVAMGNLIEESEGENFVTISFLEKYCEAVYQIYQSIANGENIDVNKTEKSLRKGLIAAENSIRNDIKIRKEVVFFPYKASMWDSLESVYLAAKADPDCDAYCVPIPYFDKNPDGTVKEMHYEGREYPANIEIIDWQSYNFEERKPDVIYIHNPYDQFNYVTSVHPRFYASNLQKYTNELVYIPYFVLTEIEPDDQAAIEGMKHFCYLPGTIYADKVILQSENMRQIYINEYMKACKRLDDQELRKDLEKRFFGTGSPKFDKVLNTKKEDLEIPEDWLKIIEKPDGNWKKIILYNTSVGALLQYDEKMLQKMQTVFETFKENKDEVALLWRPHPLIQATIESMRPQLWEQYKAIVEQYKAEGWGIYDDSTNLDRAIVLSDAYYGDGSSVVQLYHKTGKPIAVQRVEIDEKNINLYFYDSMVIDNELWFSAINVNGLFKYNFESSKLDFISSFSNENFSATFLHSRMMRYDNKIIFIPFQAKEIAAFNLDTSQICTIKLKESIFGSQYSMFYTAIQEDNYIYLIPCRYGYLVRYNAINDEVTYYEVFKKEQGSGWDVDYPFIHKGACKVGDKMYLASFTDDFIEEYNLITGECQYFKIAMNSNGITNLFYKNGYFWVIGRNGDICKWDMASDKEEIFHIADNNEMNHVFFDAVCYEEKIYLSGALSNDIYILDTYKNEKKILQIGNVNKQKDFPLFWGNFPAIISFSNEELAVMCAQDGHLYMINTDELVVKKDRMNFSFDAMDYFIKNNVFIVTN